MQSPKPVRSSSKHAARLWFSALVVAIVASLGGAASAFASPTTYCVVNPACVTAGGVDEGSNLQAALTAAQSNAGADTVSIGSTGGSPLVGPFTYTGDGANTVAIQGQSIFATQLTSGATGGQTVLSIAGTANSTIFGLNIHIPAVSGDTGLSLAQAGTAESLFVDDQSGSSNSTGVYLNNATFEALDAAHGAGVALQGGLNTAIEAHGASSVLDAGVQGVQRGIYAPDGTLTVKRARIQAFAPVVLRDGTFELHSSAIGITPGGSGGTALDVSNTSGHSVSVTALGLTVGGGDAASRAVAVTNSGLSTDTAGLVIANSLIGSGHALNAFGGGAPGNVAAATLSVSYSDWDPSHDQTGGPPSSASITDGGHNVHVLPNFVNPASDFHLQAGSPVIDAADVSLASGSSTDVEGKPRNVNGLGAGTSTCPNSAHAEPCPDMGAYEYQPPAATAPAVASQHATDATVNSGTVAADISPHGAATSYYVEYGPTSSYGSQTSTQNDVTTSGSFTATVGLSSLSANTTYHYRFVASNSAGPIPGTDATFETPAAYVNPCAAGSGPGSGSLSANAITGTGVGTLDASFNNKGFAFSPFSGGTAGTARAFSVVSQGIESGQPSTKLVVGGCADNGNSFALARYNANGTLDYSFDGDGLVTTTTFAGGAAVGDAGLAMQGDKPVLAGTVGSGTQFGVARYLSNGSPDSSFNATGRATATFGGYPSVHATSMLIDSTTDPADPRILVVGYGRHLDGQTDILIARFHSDGTLDQGFGFGGEASDRWGSDVVARTVVMQNGRYLVAGTLNGSQIALTRFIPTTTANHAQRDLGFGSAGRKSEAFGEPIQVTGMSLDLQGRIVVAFTVVDNYGVAVFHNVAQNGDGSGAWAFDNTFGSGGVLLTSFGSVGASVAHSGMVLVQPSGRILVGGSGNANTPNSNVGLVSRYQPENGALDFIGAVGPGPNTHIMSGVTLGNQVVLVGDAESEPGTNPGFFIARMNMGIPPTISTNVGTGSSTTTATFRGVVNARGSAVTYSWDYGVGATGGYESHASPNPSDPSQTVPTDNSDHTIQSDIFDLKPGTVYHYRIRATNAAARSENACIAAGAAAGCDTVYGVDQTFKTVGAASTTVVNPTVTRPVTPHVPPTVPPVVPPKPPGPTPGPAIRHVSVDANGAVSGDVFAPVDGSTVILTEVKSGKLTTLACDYANRCTGFVDCIAPDVYDLLNGKCASKVGLFRIASRTMPALAAKTSPVSIGRLVLLRAHKGHVKFKLRLTGTAKRKLHGTVATQIITLIQPPHGRAIISVKRVTLHLG